MNAKVDAITDAVEAAIARGNNHPGGVRRFILQGAIRGALRDISDRRIAPRRLYGAGPNAGGRPTTSRPVPRWSRLDAVTIADAVHRPSPITNSTGAAMERRWWHHGWTPWRPSVLRQPRWPDSGGVSTRLRLRHRRRLPPAAAISDPDSASHALLRRRRRKPHRRPAPEHERSGRHLFLG
ncbi:hypothetical protein BDA96_01G419300 [Sorghum bicolor]|uniref:Uncharacterized protein n=2 Tax=Sorghum bicolor TaxID=4558 RepID=A0A921S4F0_SORBI|nr:hypothetical protein SORBI_3001G394466 [Sorghum bicolor]KAG0551391.1 hypothetical protein BDA96_01G419300 [Sorghum bicolor]